MQAGNFDYVLKFAGTEARDMKLLTMHYYRGRAQDRAPRSRGSSIAMTAGNTACRSCNNSAKQNDLSFRINEVNSFYGGGKPGVSDTFASALVVSGLHVPAGLLRL